MRKRRGLLEEKSRGHRSALKGAVFVFSRRPLWGSLPASQPKLPENFAISGSHFGSSLCSPFVALPFCVGFLLQMGPDSLPTVAFATKRKGSRKSGTSPAPLPAPSPAPLPAPPPAPLPAPQAAAASSSDRRSRSPLRPALPGLRADAPGRKAVGGVARVPSLGSAEERVAALNELDRDVLASTTSRTNAARMHTIEDILSKWGLAVFPPTPMSWKALAATLKAGGYRSAAVYLSTYKVESERRGHPTDASTERHIKDYTRSCLRGLGAAARPRALDLLALGSLPLSRAVWVEGGPVNSRAAVLVGA